MATITQLVRKYAAGRRIADEWTKGCRHPGAKEYWRGYRMALDEVLIDMTAGLSKQLAEEVPDA